MQALHILIMLRGKNIENTSGKKLLLDAVYHASSLLNEEIILYSDLQGQTFSHAILLSDFDLIMLRGKNIENTSGKKLLLDADWDKLFHLSNAIPDRFSRFFIRLLAFVTESVSVRKILPKTSCSIPNLNRQQIFG